ncbi:hypothetical protein [Pedobacter sp. GR22-6]|uniref:hypothetical protein n=1 Tax=Pedobacter sp. GR22-6 TaxID=3127957 RepID=UPI00307EF8C0
MQLQELINNLKQSKTLIEEYAELHNRSWQLQFNAHNYNRNRLFNILGIGVGAFIASLYLATDGISSAIAVLFSVLPITYIFVRFGIGSAFNYKGRKVAIQHAGPLVEHLSAQMNVLVETLDSFSMLPEKYRTLQAVNAIRSYLLNKRAESLKEAINLYEEEVFRHSQIQRQQFQIQQNHQMIQQNREMIKAQKTTNSRLLWASILGR